MYDADTWHGIISMSKEAEMVKLINRYTGNEMYVSEDRAEEYKAAGHRLAVSVDDLLKPRKAAPKKPVKKQG